MSEFPATDFALEEIGDDLQDRAIIDPTTFVYADIYLIPYEEELKEIEDPSFIPEWVHQKFSSPIADRILDELHGLGPASMEKIRATILFLIAQGFFGLSGDTTIVDGIDNTILPWDINANLSADWAQTFGIDPSVETLPVTVRRGGLDFEYELTIDQALGMLFVSSQFPTDFTLHMFDQPLKYFQDPNQSRYSGNWNRYPTYRLLLKNTLIFFEDLRFLQGMKTGAEWAGVDFELLTKNIVYLSAEDSEPIPMRLEKSV